MHWTKLANYKYDIWKVPKKEFEKIKKALDIGENKPLTSI